MNSYRVAHIGCGSRGADHVRALAAAAPRLELVGLCDRESRRLTELGELAQTSAARYGDPEAMLAELRPDILSFCTQPDVRLPLVELGAAHGVRAIVLEKPMALTLAEARQMCRVAEAAGVLLVVSHQHKYADHWQNVYRLASSGQLGRVRTIHATSLGWMMHYATHLVDYVSWLNGYNPIVAVAGHVHGRDYLQDIHSGVSHPSPGYFMGHLEFANGVRGIVECGTFAPEQTAGVPFWFNAGATVVGTEGMARVVIGKGWTAVTCDGEHLGSDEVAFRGMEDSIPLHLEVADCLDDPSRLHSCRAEMAYHGFEAMIAICQSAMEHRRVALPFAALVDGADRSADVLQRMFRDIPGPGGRA